MNSIAKKSKNDKTTFNVDLSETQLTQMIKGFLYSGYHEFKIKRINDFDSVYRVEAFNKKIKGF